MHSFGLLIANYLLLFLEVQVAKYCVLLIRTCITYPSVMQDTSYKLYLIPHSFYSGLSNKQD